LFFKVLAENGDLFHNCSINIVGVACDSGGTSGETGSLPKKNPSYLPFCEAKAECRFSLNDVKAAAWFPKRK